MFMYFVVTSIFTEMRYFKFYNSVIVESCLGGLKSIENVE